MNINNVDPIKTIQQTAYEAWEKSLGQSMGWGEVPPTIREAWRLASVAAIEAYIAQHVTDEGHRLSAASTLSADGKAFVDISVEYPLVQVTPEEARASAYRLLTAATTAEAEAKLVQFLTEHGYVDGPAVPVVLNLFRSRRMSGKGGAV